MRDRSGLAWLLGRPGRIGRGAVIVWILTGTHLLLMLTASHPIYDYYQLPLYSVVPYWIGSLLGWVGARGPRLAGAALLALLTLNGWADLAGSIGAQRFHAPLWAR